MPSPVWTPRCTHVCSATYRNCPGPTGWSAAPTVRSAARVSTWTADISRTSGAAAVGTGVVETEPAGGAAAGAGAGAVGRCWATTTVTVTTPATAAATGSANRRRRFGRTV